MNQKRKQKQNENKNNPHKSTYSNSDKDNIIAKYELYNHKILKY